MNDPGPTSNSSRALGPRAIQSLVNDIEDGYTEDLEQQQETHELIERLGRRLAELHNALRESSVAYKDARSLLQAAIQELQSSWAREHLAQEQITAIERRIEELEEELRQKDSRLRATEAERDAARREAKELRRRIVTPTPTPTPPDGGRRPPMDDDADPTLLTRLMGGIVWVLSQAWFWVAVLAVTTIVAGKYEWFSGHMITLLIALCCAFVFGRAPLKQLKKGDTTLILFPVRETHLSEGVLNEVKDDGTKRYPNANWNPPLSKRAFSRSHTKSVLLGMTALCWFAAMAIIATVCLNLNYVPVGVSEWLAICWIVFLALILSNYPCWLPQEESPPVVHNEDEFRSALNDLNALPADNKDGRKPHLVLASLVWMRAVYSLNKENVTIRFTKASAKWFFGLALLIPIWGGLGIPRMVANELELRGHTQAATWTRTVLAPRKPANELLLHGRLQQEKREHHHKADKDGNVQVIKLQAENNPLVELWPHTIFEIESPEKGE